uniref:OTU domain-containing protein n=1 Tax=Heterorhabditis bacteriophora TaxID=37862 RepID=A0A1I7WV92_HETBA
MTEVDNIVTASKAEAADGTPEDSLGTQAEYVDGVFVLSAYNIMLVNPFLKHLINITQIQCLEYFKVYYDILYHLLLKNLYRILFIYFTKDMLESFDYIRQIRRDGNCFYRAVLVAEIELMLIDPEECKRADNEVFYTYLNVIQKIKELK